MSAHRSAQAVLAGSRASTVIRSDAVRVLGSFATDSIDALVTDPPAGIGFMGFAWDTFGESLSARVGRAAGEFGATQNPPNLIERPSVRKGKRFREAITPVFDECLRVLKPGAHAVVWALPRTAHWTAASLEDAGFEIRDVITHVFASGLPKSKNLSGERIGWGTGLKPASEHWILARKPLVEPTVDANVRRFATGALHIDATRIPAPVGAGRWPANVAFSHGSGCSEHCAPSCPVALLDEQSGWRQSGLMRAGTRRKRSGGYRGGFPDTATQHDTYGDAGGASRFFAVFAPFYYSPKASRAERDAGLGDLSGSNHHPTVKPVALMRMFVRLVTPVGGVVLDPFCGSGSTGIATTHEGMRFIGIEQDRDYCKIARARIAFSERHATKAATCVAPRGRGGERTGDLR